MGMPDFFWAQSLQHNPNERAGKATLVHTRTVILAAGGFEAKPCQRSAYHAAGEDLAHVRGTPCNTGECLELIICHTVTRPTGLWLGRRAVAWGADSDPAAGHRGSIENVHEVRVTPWCINGRAKEAVL
jgi:hypothetical protein